MLLGATDDIRGLAGTATAIDYTISVQEKSTSGLAWKIGADGQLPSTVADLYSVPASTSAIVDSVTLYNTSASTITCTISVRQGAGTARVWFRGDLAQDEQAEYIRGRGWEVRDSSGLIKEAVLNRSGTTFPTAPYDGQPFYRTDLDWDFNYDQTRGKWLGQIETMSFSRSGTTSPANPLRWGGNLIADGASNTAFKLPFNITIVGVSAGHNTTAATAGDLVVVDQSNTHIAYAGTQLTASVLDAYDMTVNANMAQDDYASVEWLNWGLSSIPSAGVDEGWLVAWYRRRAT